MTQLAPSALVAALPQIPVAWLRDRRWFSSKGRQLTELTVSDWGALPLAEPAIIALARARYADGFEELLLLPLLATREALPVGVRAPAAATLTQDGVVWQIHDAFQHEAFQRLLMTRLLSGEDLPLTHGRITFAPEAALRAAPPPLREIRLVAAEQSNTSIIYDHQAILKCFRRVVAGVNPDVEVSRFLTRVGFRHTPALLGSLSYWRDGVEHSLAILQEFVPNRGDAWDYTLQRLAAFYEAVPTDATLNRAEQTRRLAAVLLDELRELGRLTGKLHRALAGDAADPDFAPRPLDEAQARAWQQALHAQAEATLELLAARRGALPDDLLAVVETLLAARERIRQRIAGLERLAQAGVLLTRYHGDYHLGQVLVSERGFLILDFEGEPLRPLAERRAHGSPLKDVAGMLRSLSYAAQSSLRTATRRDVDLAPWALAWESEARGAFLQGYRAATAAAPFVPRDAEVFNAALAAFELEKALYEVRYELNNRPDWLPIPLAGIQRVL
ncbi:putative maltokinase [Kallotenue papyrolyticum]|uniref:putative maltokinase n=1 Tax=Kallotenue papyrolyticum TaxID=1325125 RepID=UPI0004925A39|nr:putative maltokinase [Kallotenue papyrolyticum]